MSGISVKFGPCCFCGRDIAVETAVGKWQVWKCRGACFREKLAELPEAPGLFEPDHF